ncbi:MAG: citrate lyase acyl carrier protein [Bacillota bacterium]|jgi:citrate lyase subunit gamma (acyl carrier protein)
MKIKRNAVAGTLESSDLLVTVAPGSNGREIIIKSVVAAQYHNVILKLANDVLDEYGISDIYLEIEDRGALDFAIRARLETALLRAGGDL